MISNIKLICIGVAFLSFVLFTVCTFIEVYKKSKTSEVEFYYKDPLENLNAYSSELIVSNDSDNGRINIYKHLPGGSKVLVGSRIIWRTK